MEGIPDPSLYPSRGLWPGKGPNQVCFNSVHTCPLFLVDLFHFDLISPLKCIKERSHQSTGLQHIPWRTNSLKLRNVIYLKLWPFPLSTLHYIKKSWMWHLHFKVIFILYSRERKNWHKRSISTSLIQWRMQNVTDGWAWIKSRWAWIYGCSEIKAGFPDNVVS